MRGTRLWALGLGLLAFGSASVAGAEENGAPPVEIRWLVDRPRHDRQTTSAGVGHETFGQDQPVAPVFRYLERFVLWVGQPR